MATKAKHRTRGDLQLEAAKKKELRAQFGLDFKGQRVYPDLPPHLQPSDMHLFNQEMKRQRRRRK